MKYLNKENVTALLVVVLGVTLASIFVIGPVSRWYAKLTMPKTTTS